MTKKEKKLEAKRAAFGTGTVIYKEADDFPDTIKSSGMLWYRTMYEYETVKTGMKNYLYETFDTDRDIRLYIDAAGNVWDEAEMGIL